MVHHVWTPLERHFLHIFFSAYGPPDEGGYSLTDLERLFSHVHGSAFKNGPPDADRLRDEYAARGNTGRSKMWRNIIVKDPANYTYQEQLDRVQAHRDMKQAAVALGIDLQPVHVELLPPDVVAPAAPASTKPDQNSDAGKAPEDSQSSATDTYSPGPEPDMRGVNVIVPNRDPILRNYRKRRAVDAAPAPAPVAPSLRVRQRQAPSTTNQADTRLTQTALIAKIAAQAATEGDTATLSRLSAVGAPAPHASSPNTTNDSASQVSLLTNLTTNIQTLETRFNALQQSHYLLQNRVHYLEQQREGIPGPLFHQIIQAHAPDVADAVMLRAEVDHLRDVLERKDEEIREMRKQLAGAKEAVGKEGEA